MAQPQVEEVENLLCLVRNRFSMANIASRIDCSPVSLKVEGLRAFLRFN